MKKRVILFIVLYVLIFAFGVVTLIDGISSAIASAIPQSKFDSLINLLFVSDIKVFAVLTIEFTLLAIVTFALGTIRKDAVIHTSVEEAKVENIYQRTILRKDDKNRVNAIIIEETTRKE